MVSSALNEDHVGAALSHEDTSTPQIRIREFRPDDAAQIATIFHEGIMGYTNESDAHYQIVVDYVSHSLKDDLADIERHYMRDEGSRFFVATASGGSGGEHEVIAGCIGIQKQSESAAELRRVSVKAEFRRFGIGRLLMNHATQWAQQRNYIQLILSTAAMQHSALKFYKSLGYTHTKTTVFSEDPHFELVYFEKSI